MAPPMIDRLWPPGDPVTADDLVAALRPWEDPPPERPRVLVNMVATLDGHITVDGRSGPIGGDGDHALFHALRTYVDAVLVGGGTLRVENYGRLVNAPERREKRVAAGLAADPLALLITRTGELRWDARMFDAPEQHVVVVTHPSAAPFPRVRARVERVEIDAPTPLAALREIRARHGVRAVLCEGGPTLNRGLLADGAMDELFLSLGPLLAGGDDALRLLAGEPLDVPARAQLRWVARHGDEVFLRYAITGG